VSPPPYLQNLITKVLERSDSFQGRVAARGQIQVALNFPQNAKWVALFRDWWRQGLPLARAHAGRIQRWSSCASWDRPTMRSRCTRRELSIAGRKPRCWRSGRGDMERRCNRLNLEAAQSAMRTAPAVIKTPPNPTFQVSARQEQHRE